MPRQYVNPANLSDFKAAGKPLSHAVRVENTLYVSGQVGVSSEGRVLQGAAEQAELAWEKIRTVLSTAGGTLADVVSVTVYLTDITDLEHEHSVRRRLFSPDACPAATVVEVSALAIPGLVLEITVTAVLGPDD